MAQLQQALTRMHGSPVRSLPTPTTASSSSTFPLSSCSRPALSRLLLKPNPERARAYRAHISVSVRLRLPHLFVRLRTRAPAFACGCNRVCATNP